MKRGTRSTFMIHKTAADQKKIDMKRWALYAPDPDNWHDIKSDKSEYNEILRNKDHGRIKKNIAVLAFHFQASLFPWPKPTVSL